MCDFTRFDGASDEWLALEKTLPVSQEDIPLPELKLRTNSTREAAAAKAFQGMVDELAVTDHVISTRDGQSLQARSYRTLTRGSQVLPLYIHFHGGGYLFGTLDSENATCGRLALQTGIAVLNVNYRHTPEHPYPTAWLDAEDAIEWAYQNSSRLLVDPGQIIVGGVSAGGNLSASVALSRHIARKSPALKGQLLMIPTLVHLDCYDSHLARMVSPGVSSMIVNANAPVLPVARMRFFTDLLQVRDPDPLDIRHSPGNASDEQIKGLAPTFIVVAGLDPLRDEGILYGQRCAYNE